MMRNEIKKEILDIRIPVLTKGYVELCNYLGDDETIVRCARESYGKNEDELSEKEIDKQIEAMLKNGHTSPFEQVVFQFHLKMPIFVQRHIIRHRTARVNEISGRYTKFNYENFYVPNEMILENRKSYQPILGDLETEEEEAIRKNKTRNLIDRIMYINHTSYEQYEAICNMGIPPEVARIGLPLSLFTEFYWQIDLNNLLHFLKLRLDEHAQKETRIYAGVILEFVKEICPITIKHFMNHTFNAISLSCDEMKNVTQLLNTIKNENLIDINDEKRDIIEKLSRHLEKVMVRENHFGNKTKISELCHIAEDIKVKNENK
jgi:thymidylate synthase (FAD)